MYQLSRRGQLTTGLATVALSWCVNLVHILGRSLIEILQYRYSSQSVSLSLAQLFARANYSGLRNKRFTQRDENTSFHRGRGENRPLAKKNEALRGA